MATTKKAKTANTTVKKAATTKKKSATQEQIEKLEKALGNVNEENIVDLVPEDIKESVKADIEASEEFGKPESINAEGRIKEMLEKAEPSEELKKQFREIEESKAELNEKIEKEPNKAEELIMGEIKKMEALKKKAEALRVNIQKSNDRNTRNEGFTNWWNGSSGLY